MRSLLRKALRRYDSARSVRREARLLPDAEWRAILSAHRIPVQEAVLEADGRLSLPELDVTLAKSPSPLGFLHRYELAKELRREAGAIYTATPEGIFAEFHGVKHAIETPEDLFILGEIYQGGVYDCSIHSPVVIMDIGANAGFSSLFFAKQIPDCVVEGFEPVGTTYQRALRNLALNEGLSQRIKLHHHGLAAQDSQGMMLFDSARPGNATLLRDNLFTASVAEEVPVLLSKASRVVNEVRQRHAGKRLILKLDCEGSEYEIVRELEATGTLDCVDGILAEWHRVSTTVDCDELCRTLSERGFMVCANGRFSTGIKAGMLYAFRVGAPRT